MSGCCDPRGCDSTFTERFARRTAAQYRRRGLDRTAARMVRLLEQRGVRDASVLEVGGGVGAISIELLKRGAARATDLELSPAYEQQAERLLVEAGLTSRVDRRIVDIAADPSAVEAADIVVAHRVVCCYPDHAALLGALATHTRHVLVFSHPPRTLLSRALTAVENLGFRLRGSEFRVFVHPPTEMLAVLEQHGLQPVASRGTLVWRIQVAAR